MQNPIIKERYRILQQLGVGGFGLTYLAEDLQLQTRPRTVVKHLRPQINDAETLNLANKLFQQEAEVLYRLGGHPQIPSLIAHFKENGEFFLVQEFVEGQTLDREFTGGRRYNQKDIIQFLGQTLEILAFVHSQKVIHRDVKPTNLIRRASDGNIFLIDFGAVKQVGAMPHETAESSSVAVGSHGYMPTEQMAGSPNFSSDLYALGLVAIQALTGTKPLDLLRSAANEFVWANKAQLSPELERFISKLVRQDYRQRFFSAGEALAALNSIAANTGYFNARPPVMMKVQPINQNYHPAPIHDPSFVPPTVIVPAQSAPRPNPSRQVTNTNEPKKSSALPLFLTVVGFLFFIGFLFIAGKVLNFRWSSLDERRETARQTEISTPVKSNVSLFNEAIEQAQEAEIKEKNATTRFEWEEIAGKYRRAFGLLKSIQQTNPDYARAQEKIQEYEQKADAARERAKKLSN